MSGPTRSLVSLVLALLVALALALGSVGCSDDARTKKKYDFSVPDLGPDGPVPDGAAGEGPPVDTGTPDTSPPPDKGPAPDSPASSG